MDYWLIYIYHSSNKRKRLLISYSNLEWRLTLSCQWSYSLTAVMVAVKGFHHLRALHTTQWEGFLLHLRPWSAPVYFERMTSGRKYWAIHPLLTFDCRMILIQGAEWKFLRAADASAWLDLLWLRLHCWHHDESQQNRSAAPPQKKPFSSLSTFHTEDRKGLSRLHFLMTQEKHFLQIVYSQNFCLWGKKDKTNVVSLDISPPSSSPLWYFYIQGASHVFGVKEFWRVLLDLYCLVKCSYNHSPMWSTLSFSPSSIFFVLLKARFFGASCTL